ncbi:5'/3'-nucleotidase SurE [soil metagenome]
MKKEKTQILLANDDGIDAAGIRALHEELRDHYDVLVVAPLSEKSGAGCSLSLSSEMVVEKRSDGGKVWGYGIGGTPADCVKFAMTALNGYRPAFVLSGINRGVNLGNSVFYSGTVAAAIEGTLYGIPAMACSLGCFGHPVAYYEDAAKVVRALLPWLLKSKHEPRTLWNLNFPNRRLNEMGPIRFTSHGTSFFEDVFKLYREEEDVMIYRNVGDRMVACARNADSDDKAWAGGNISLSLLRTDLTIPFAEDAVTKLERDLNALLTT